jgi:hypothetical protein
VFTKVTQLTATDGLLVGTLQALALAFGGLLLGGALGMAKLSFASGRPDTFAIVVDYNRDRNDLHVFSFRGWGNEHLLQITVRRTHLLVHVRLSVKF